MSDLERKLAEASAARNALSDKVKQLEADLQHHIAARAGLEERCNSAVMRADAAEKNYARSLADHAELQRRVQTHEKTIGDHGEQFTSLTSNHQQLLAENNELKERLQNAEEELQKHVETVELSQQALIAANSRSDEVHSLWERSVAELATHRSRSAQLESDLASRELAHNELQSKHSDLERLHKALQADHSATKALASGGLADLLASRSHSRNRSISSDHHEERVKAVEDELASLRELHRHAKTSAETSNAQLADARSREADLQSQLAQLQSEISQLRRAHHQALDEVRNHQSIAAQRHSEAREAARARDAADVKVGLLRNILSDHGLSVDDNLHSRPSPLPSDATPEQLQQRIQELESRLEDKTRSHSELATAHEQAKNEAQEHEHRHREAVRQHQTAVEQADQLKVELQSLRSDGPRSAAESDRASKAVQELDALQSRHRQLEQTHLKAVQYVKGTEKMLRRMKEVTHCELSCLYSRLNITVSAGALALQGTQRGA